jgi:hypothetical protein
MQATMDELNKAINASRNHKMIYCILAALCLVGPDIIIILIEF